LGTQLKPERLIPVNPVLRKKRHKRGARREPLQQKRYLSTNYGGKGVSKLGENNDGRWGS